MSPEGYYRLVPGVRKIAVVRANAIGDLMFILPALEALRAAYPGAEIVLLGLKWHARFLNGRPSPIDRVAVIPPLRGVSLQDIEDDSGYAGEVQDFLEDMRRERFDLAVQLHGGGKYSNPFTRSLGARVTVGLKAPEAEPLDRWLPYEYWQREVLRYLEVVSLVGARPVTLEPRLSVIHEDLEESYRVVPETAGRMVLIHPGVSNIMRRWPVEKFAAVGDALAARGLEVLVTAGRGDERELVEGVINGMRYPARDLWGRLSLGGLVGLLSRCDLVVGNDSGPLQVAVALGTPTVGIFWCGNLVTAGPVTQARHRQVVSWRLDCPVCGHNTLDGRCEHDVSFVSDVPVDAVVSAAMQLLDDDRARTRRLPVFEATHPSAWAS